MEVATTKMKELIKVILAGEVVKIHCRNGEESRAIQEICFANKIYWPGEGPTRLIHLNETYLFINDTSGGTKGITYAICNIYNTVFKSLPYKEWFMETNSFNKEQSKIVKWKDLWST